MRIVHFSDIHARARFQSLRSMLDKRLLGFWNYYIRRHRFQDWRRVQWFVEQLEALKPDVVICTGDVTSLGEPNEFELASEALAPLVENPSFEFLYVPGNHDVYVRCHKSRAALESTFQYLNRDRWKLEALPVRYQVNQLDFLLINQGCPAPLYGSFGAMDASSLEWIERHFGNGSPEGERPLVLVNHFPMRNKHGEKLTWRRGCHGNEPLHDAWQAGQIQMALCGHIHHPFKRQSGGGALEVCAGSLTQTGTFSVVDFNPDTGEFCQSWHDVKPVLS